MKRIILTIFLAIGTSGLIAQEHTHGPDCTSCGTTPKPSSTRDRLDIKMGLVVDAFAFYNDSDSKTVNTETLSGFGHGHHEDDHDHRAVENGLNLRHVELTLFASGGDNLDGWVTLAVEEDDVELEEAVVRLGGCPEGFSLLAGKLLSNFGLHNAQHSHSWSFWDRPLIYSALLGDHGLGEKGIQITWAPPALPFNIGMEALQGENERSFASLDADALPDKGGPRLWTGWISYSPDLSDRQSIGFKLSGATGYHQEEHDENDDETMDHWFHGRTVLLGAGLDYRIKGSKGDGVGDLDIRAEYIYRRQHLEVTDHLLEPDVIGNNLEREQDGYYVQALYGVAPGWRVGLRWDEIGVKNKTTSPEGESESFGPSRRLSASVDWRISESSLIRFQANRGDYERIEREDKNVEFVLQWQLTFGGHRH